MYSHTYSVPCYPRHHQAFSSMVNDCFKSSKHRVSLWFQVAPFQLLSSNKNFEGKEASQSLPGLHQTFKSHVNESWCNPKMILIQERTLAKCLWNSKTMRKETLWKWLLQASKFKPSFHRLCWPIELQLWPVTSDRVKLDAQTQLAPKIPQSCPKQMRPALLILGISSF